MSRDGYFRGCLREIRWSNYGRDARQPIADAIEGLKDHVYAEDISELEDLEASRVVAFSLVPNSHYGDGFYTLNVVRANQQ